MKPKRVREKNIFAYLQEEKKKFRGGGGMVFEPISKP
jgi:hypothetical protein